MTRVLLPIANDSEEIEAVTIADVLRRAGVEVCIASVHATSRTITASRGVRICADEDLNEQVLASDWDMLVLPGGMPGAQNLSEHKGLIERLRLQLEQGKWVAAICAAPAVVLGRHDLISQATATCYPGFQDQLKPKVARLSNDRVVVDGNLITSQGPATAMAFALKLVKLLEGEERADKIATELLFA